MQSDSADVVVHSEGQGQQWCESKALSLHTLNFGKLPEGEGACPVIGASG